MNQRCDWNGKAILLFVGLALSLNGCGGKGGGSAVTTTPTPGESVSPTGRTTPTPASTLTDADCQHFGETMKQALNAQDIGTIEGLIDTDALGAAATAGLDLSEKDKGDFAKGLKQSMGQSTGIAQQLAKTVANGGSADLLRVVEVDGRKRARMRLVMPTDGVGYVDFLLGRNAAGQLQAQDLYLFFSGELMSQTLRRPAISLVATQNRGILQRLTGAENAYIAHEHEIKSMLEAFNNGQAAEAMRIYNTLPDSLKEDKSFKLLQVRFAQKLGDAEYSRAITDLQTAFPGDASVKLISIDGYLLHKQFDKALTAIDDLDKLVGGDPYLDKIRAGTYALANKPDKARELLDTFEKEMPDLKSKR